MSTGKIPKCVPSYVVATTTYPDPNMGGLAIDFTISSPNSFGFIVIMVVIDILSKYGHFVDLKTIYNSRNVIKVFMQNIVKLHGIPKCVISNRDKCIY